MQIHTVREGESIFHIARQYDTSALTIIQNNGLSHPDRLAVGEQLIILRPTRTHTVRGTETLAEIAARYEIRKIELLRNNPDLIKRPSVYPGQLLALRYPPPRSGVCAGLGYVGEKTDEGALALALCYLSYFVFDACRITSGREIEIKETPYLSLVLNNKKTPLLRITAQGAVPDTDTVESVAQRALAKGFYGIVLGDGMLTQQTRRERDSYLLALRKRMLGLGLILFCEGDLESDYGDYADGNILLSRAMWAGDEGMGARFEKALKSYECAKTFLGLPTLCEEIDASITYAKMREIAYKYRAVMKDGKNAIGTLSYRRYRSGVSEDREIRVPTPEYLMRLIGYLSEYGMMGAAVEIGAVPTFLWMLLHTSLGEVDYALSLLACQ